MIITEVNNNLRSLIFFMYFIFTFTSATKYCFIKPNSNFRKLTKALLLISIWGRDWCIKSNGSQVAKFDKFWQQQLIYVLFFINTYLVKIQAVWHVLWWAWWATKNSDTEIHLVMIFFHSNPSWKYDFQNY